MAAMRVMVEVRQRLARDARQHARQRLQQRHLRTELAQNGGRLQSDIAAADDDHAVRAAVEIGHHRIDVAAVTDGIDADQIGARAAQSARVAARRPDQRAIADRAAILEGDGPRLRIDRRHRIAEQQVDPLLGPEGGRADIEPIEALFPRQIVLAERRALIGRLMLAADHGHGAFIAHLPQQHAELRTAMARADDDDIGLHR